MFLGLELNITSVATLAVVLATTALVYRSFLWVLLPSGRAPFRIATDRPVKDIDDPTPEATRRA
jgi:hypothetical protein